MWDCGGAQPKPHKQLLKQSSSFVLASLQPSTYLTQYASVFRLLRPCRKIRLNIRQSSR